MNDNQTQNTPKKIIAQNSNFPMKHNTPDKNDLSSTQVHNLNKQYTYGSLNIGQLDF